MEPIRFSLRIMALPGIVGFLILKTLTNCSWADTVTFKNGGSLEGEVVEENDQKVTLSLEGGTMTFQRSEVASIQRTSETSVSETTPIPYPQELASVLEEFTSLSDQIKHDNARLSELFQPGQNEEPEETVSKILATGDVEGKLSEEYEARFLKLQQQLERLTPPSKWAQFHRLFLAGIRNRKEALRWFAIASRSKNDEQSSKQASSYLRKSNQLLKEAFDGFPLRGERNSVPRPAAQETTPLSPAQAHANEKGGGGETNDKVKTYFDESEVSHKKKREGDRLKSQEAKEYFSRGVKYHEDGNYEKAIESYKQAIKLNPDSSSACANLGAIYLDKGFNAEAFKWLKQAIQLNPNNALAHYHFGVLHLKRKDVASALKEYKVLRNLDSNWADKLSRMIPERSTGSEKFKD